MLSFRQKIIFKCHFISIFVVVVSKYMIYKCEFQLPKIYYGCSFFLDGLLKLQRLHYIHANCNMEGEKESKNGRYVLLYCTKIKFKRLDKIEAPNTKSSITKLHGNGSNSSYTRRKKQHVYVVRRQNGNVVHKTPNTFVKLRFENDVIISLCCFRCFSFLHGYAVWCGDATQIESLLAPSFQLHI